MQMTIPERRKLKKAAPIALKYVLLVVFSLFFIFPYFYMLTRSLMSLPEVNSTNLILFPSELHFENYSIVVDYLPYLKNTLIVVFINGFFIPFTGSLIAFPFARYEFKGKKVMFALLMSTVMLPGSVTTIPLYALYSRLGAARHARLAVGGGVLRRQRDADLSDYSVHARRAQGAGQRGVSRRRQ